VTDAGADPRAVARRALADAVSRHGPAVLGNSVLLRKSFDDYMPEAPRELSALVAVAQAEGSRVLSERVSQGLDPDTAVRLTCSTLGEQLALDPSVLLWAVTEYADTLGFQTTVPLPTEGPPAGTVIATPGTVIASEAPGPQSPYQAPGTRLDSQAASPNPPTTPANYTVPAYGAPPSSGPPPGYGPDGNYQSAPSPSPTPRPGTRFPPAIIAIGAGVAVLAVILVAVLVSHHGGGHGSSSTTTLAAASSPAAPLGTVAGTAPPTTTAPTAPPTTVPPTTTVPAPVEATQAQINAAVLNVQDLGGPADAAPEPASLCGAYTRPDVKAFAAFSLGSNGSIGDLASLVGAYPSVAAAQQVMRQVPPTVPGCVGAAAPFTVQTVGGTEYCDQSYEGYSPFVGNGGVTLQLYMALIRCGTTLSAVELILNSNIATATAQHFANTVYETEAAKLSGVLQ
jgi:hypothetical protein